ncbi:MAG: DUF4384 domain-containing protein [Flavobacteriaceae bacterium]|nr:DUF4384 domain-containing protein [Flavobacteriaceae bacterium]
MKNISLLVLLITFVTNGFAQEQFTTGLLLSKDKYESVMQLAPLTTRSFDNIPSSISLKAYAPTPLSQGRQPSCVGWASGYAARTISYAVKKNWANNTTLINQNIFSPAFVYNIIKFKDDVNCQKGSYVADAMRLIKNYGITKLTDFPYTDQKCMSKPSNYGMKLAAQNKIETFVRLSNWDNVSNLAQKVKKALANKNPVVIGMRISSSFYKVSDVWSGVQVGKIGGHAMVVIGYDDYKYGGAFELMNSWGTRWANNGFAWVRYADFNKYVKTAYVMVDAIKTPAPKPEPKPKVTPKPEVIVLKGSLSLQLSDGSLMPVKLSDEATRNFNIVAAEKTTYSVTKPYGSGTQFRIRFQSEKPAYIYLIGYGSGDKSVNTLYPFDKYSPYFGFNNSEVAIPSEDYFIEIDNVPGRDVLCILYSTKPIDIDKAVESIKYGKGSFTSKVKSYFKTDLYKGEEVKFDKNSIAFKAISANKYSNIVPLFISINHK